MCIFVCLRLFACAILAGDEAQAEVGSAKYNHLSSTFEYSLKKKKRKVSPSSHVLLQQRIIRSFVIWFAVLISKVYVCISWIFIILLVEY